MRRGFFLAYPETEPVSGSPIPEAWDFVGTIDANGDGMPDLVLETFNGETTVAQVLLAQ